MGTAAPGVVQTAEFPLHPTRLVKAETEPREGQGPDPDL